ncbi:MAG: MFS transporter, partial [Acidimicrobiales bacterium]
PMLVESDDIGVANARLMFGHITINRLIGPPLGAVLFTLGMVVPFVAQIVAVLAGAALVLTIAAPTIASPTVMSDGEGAGSSVRTEIVEGVRWLWRHPPIRTLTLTIITFNVTFGAAWSILVLYALERLGLGEIGFGLLTTVGAVGGLLGTTIYPRLERHLSLGNIMRIGLLIETFTHFGLAMTTSPWVALPIFFVFGAHEAVWGTVATTVRQRAVPPAFQGRVTSVYLTGVYSGLVIGAVVGGLIAGRWGVTGPFWFAFAGSVAILTTIWRQLDLIAHAGS